MNLRKLFLFALLIGFVFFQCTGARLLEILQCGDTNGVQVTAKRASRSSFTSDTDLLDSRVGFYSGSKSFSATMTITPDSDELEIRKIEVRDRNTGSQVSLVPILKIDGESNAKRYTSSLHMSPDPYNRSFMP
eukprot:953702_1